MRTKLLTFLVLLLAANSYAADRASYAGQWTLDKGRSKNLPPYYDTITGHTLSIAQNGQDLAVNVEITAEGREADTFDFKYTLDDQPVQTETEVRTPNGPLKVPTVLRAKPEENGGLLITIERELPMRGETVKGTTVETWRLSEDAKTLTIDRKDESPRFGTRESVLVFTARAR